MPDDDAHKRRPRSRVVASFELHDDDLERPWPVRVRAWLKASWRRWRMKCVEIRELPKDDERGED